MWSQNWAISQPTCQCPCAAENCVQGVYSPCFRGSWLEPGASGKVLLFTGQNRKKATRTSKSIHQGKIHLFPGKLDCWLFWIVWQPSLVRFPKLKKTDCMGREEMACLLWHLSVGPYCLSNCLKTVSHSLFPTLVHSEVQSCRVQYFCLD
jgi:hypothetical protein